MCKFNPDNDGRRIDPCMRNLIKFINNYSGWETISSCCGHGKYPMTIVVKSEVVKKGLSNQYCGLEIVSGEYIERIKRFYKKDKQGFYFIPEVIKK